MDDDLQEALRARTGHARRRHVRGPVLVGNRSRRGVQPDRRSAGRGERDGTNLPRRVQGVRAAARAEGGRGAGHPDRNGAGDADRPGERGRLPGAQSLVPRHRRIHQPVHRAVRHGVGNHELVPGARQRAAGHHLDGGAGHRRGADRDRDRAVRGDSGGHRLQPLRPRRRAAAQPVRRVRRRVLDHPPATGPPMSAARHRAGRPAGVAGEGACDG